MESMRRMRDCYETIIESSNSKAGQDDELLDDLLDIVSTNTAQAAKRNAASDQGLAEKPDDSDGDDTTEMAGGPDNQKDYYEDSFDEEIDFACDEDGQFGEGGAKPGDEAEGSFEVQADGDANNDQVNFYVYDKVQIKNIYWRGCNEVSLPEGWVQVTHACGMPLYLNRQTRVCTMSRPYYIGQSSARKHDIPISAIPCLAYRKRKEEIDQQIKEHNQAKLDAKNAAKCPFKKETNGHDADPSAAPQASASTISEEGQQQEQKSDLKPVDKKVTVSIQTSEEKLKESMLAAEKVNEYCKRLFEFDVIKVKKFKTWNDRKKFMRKAKQRKIPESSKMLKIQTKTQKGISKELNINMTNKTALSILYEYFNQVFKTNPRFEIEEKENPKDPFQAICYINDKVCGRGTGNSKKAAKNNAAEAALCVLIPDFKSSQTDQKKNSDDLYSFFDGYNVEHSHIYSLSQKLGAPLPYDILLTCLKYNFAINMSRNTKQFIEEEIKPIKYRNCLYRMKLAQYDVEVNCSKKKEGRQLASQKILKLMHPHIQTWGSILRLYGSRMAETYLNVGNKDQKNDDNEDSNEPTTTESISEKSQNTASVVSNSGESSAVATGESSSKGGSTAATSSAIINGKAKPNKELLEKLKEEMRKLRKATSNDKPTESSNETASKCPKQQTLLTIPPLLLGESEFKLSSCNYLMNADSHSTNQPKDNDEDKIMLCESKEIPGSSIQLSMDFHESKNGASKYKKRKLEDGDMTSDSDDESSSDQDSDSDENENSDHESDND